MLGRLGVSIPTVACFDAAVAGGRVCEPQGIWAWWGNPVPSWTILDADGTVIDVLVGANTTVDAIESVLTPLLDG